MEISSAFIEPKGPLVFEKESRDVVNDNLDTARDIGTARLHHSRLNVFTSLSEGDKEDNFKFHVASRGPLRLGLGVNGKELRIQILKRVGINQAGRIIADSKEGTGSAFEKFGRLTSAKGETFEAGEYFIRVSRPAKSDVETDQPYSLQLQIGSIIKKDFDTTEFAAPDPKPGDALKNAIANANANPSAAILGALGALSMLTDGLNNFLNILRPVAKDLFFPGGLFK